MSLGITDNTYYTAIASAIREKTGTSDTYAPNQMADAVMTLNDMSPFVEGDGFIRANYASFVPSYRFPFYKGITGIDLPACDAVYKSAFLGCGNLSMASLPACKYVGSDAFSQCENLMSASLPECTDTGSGAFWYCTKLSYAHLPKCHVLRSSVFARCFSLEEAVVPECVTIEDMAFSDCSKMTYIDLPKCKTIGSNAFYHCYVLSGISAPNCTSLASYVFRMCSSLASISLPKCSNIGEYAFYGCTALSSVDLPLVRELSHPFVDCESIEYVSMPMLQVVPEWFCSWASSTLRYVNINGALQIGSSAFYRCASLSRVDMLACKSVYMNAFSGCTSLESANLPECITVGAYAFASCSSLSVVSLPNCASMGYYALAYCALTSLDLPNLISVDSGAFRLNENLSWVSVPKLQVVPSYLFSGMSKLTYVNINGASSINDNAFYNCTSLSEISIVTPSNPHYVVMTGQHTFGGCSSLTVNLPTQVSFPYPVTQGPYVALSWVYGIRLPSCTSLCSSAFQSCQLVSFYAPLVNEVPTQCFKDCHYLADVSMPACTTVNAAAFQNCYGSDFTSIELPECTVVSDVAFQSCSGLATVRVPKCTAIGGYAFSDCRMLTSLYLTSVSGVTTLTDNGAWFSTTPIGGYSTYAGKYGSVYVPKSLVTAFKAASGWSSISSRIVGV